MITNVKTEPLINIFANPKSVEILENLTILDFLNDIKFGKYKNQVEQIRKESDKEIRQKLKLFLPAVTISGIFNKSRKQDNILKHSGFICLDIDTDEYDRNRIESDLYTYSCFTSTSGKGLAVIVKVEPEKHKECYDWLKKYYYHQFGIPLDPAPSNVASLRYVSYDSNLKINEKSKKSPSLGKTPRISSNPMFFDDSQIGELIRNIATNGYSICDSYEEYLHIGFALASHFGESGRDYFHLLAATSTKYKAKLCDIQYNHCLKPHNGQRIGIGTLYYYAKQSGVQIPKYKQNQQIVLVASNGKQRNATQQEIVKQLVTVNGFEELSASQIVKQVYESDIELGKTIDTDAELIDTVVDYLTKENNTFYNIYQRRLHFNNIVLEEDEMNTVFLKIKALLNHKNFTWDFFRRVITSSMIPKLDPFLDYIEKNSYRSTTGNIDRLISSVVTDTPAAEIYIRKWLKQMFASIYGKFHRNCLVFISTNQNIGKTTWFRDLLPKSLTNYYAETKFNKGTDDEILICENLIIINDEFEGMRKGEESLFKEYVSKRFFYLRVPYGHFNQKYRRLGIFGGTSNKRKIIQSDGNTRILPVEVKKIIFEAYNSVDKDELFMELYREYCEDPAVELDEKEINDIINLSKEYTVENPEIELLNQFFIADNSSHEFMTTTMIKSYIELNSGQKITSIKNFGECCRVFFGSPISKVISKGADSVKCYPVSKKVVDTKITDNSNEYTETSEDSDNPPSEGFMKAPY